MIKILDIKKYDTQNGPGIRCSIWFSGCSNHCEGCWSPQTWDSNQGTPLVEMENTLKEYLSNPKIKGVSLLGGDPFFHLMNDNTSEEDKTYLINIFKMCKELGKNVWVWSGYNFEVLYNKVPQVFEYIDVLVDGRFVIKEKNMLLKYRGSNNQRIIDIQKTLKENKVVLHED